MQKIRGIVFDLDGTLVDSLSTTFAAFNHGITLCGGREHTPAELMAYFGPGEGEIFSQILGAEHSRRAYEASREHMMHHMGSVPLHGSVASLLEHLKTKGLPLSICTGRSWNTTELILRHHGILDDFVTIVCHDHVSAPKPSPIGLQLCLQRMNLTADEVLFVGDSPVDMLAAKLAGAHGVGALWDLMANRKDLAAHSPKHFAANPLEILTFI